MSTAVEPEVETVAPEALLDAPSLSMEGACKVLGVSRRTVYYWIREGRLRTYRTSMGSQRVLTDSVKSVWTARA